MPSGVYKHKRIPPEERFFRHVEVADNGCWIWTAARNGKYGQFGVHGPRVQLAHRFSYEMHVGPIPKGFTIDHLCRNTLCVNPQHLEAVTLRENILRGNHPSIVAHRAGTCQRGHERTPENTYWSPNGARHCIVCRNLIRDTDEYRAKAAKYARERRRKWPPVLR